MGTRLECFQKKKKTGTKLREGITAPGPGM